MKPTSISFEKESVVDNEKILAIRLKDNIVELECGNSVYLHVNDIDWIVDVLSQLNDPI
jgi:hypothetical protein